MSAKTSVQNIMRQTDMLAGLVDMSECERNTQEKQVIHLLRMNPEQVEPFQQLLTSRALLLATQEMLHEII